MVMVERILLIQLESEMDGSSSGSFFSISEIQSSSVGYERSGDASCIRSSMTYGSDSRPLLVG